MPANQQIPAFQFQVDFGAGAVGGFRSVSGLGAETAVIEYREGSDKLPAVRKFPALNSYGNLTLRRGLTQNLDLWQWFQSKERRNVTILLLDEQFQPQMRILCRNAWPCKWELSELDASRSEVAAETIEIVHEGLSIESV